jgi:hypothetical protein
MKKVLTLVLAVSLVGCGADASGGACPYQAAVYELTALETNDMMCESGGESLISGAQAEGHTHFIATCTIFFGQKVNAVYSCGDESACTEIYNTYLESQSLPSIVITDYTFAIAGKLRQINGSGDECNESDYSEGAVDTDGETILAIEKSWQLTGVGESADGLCDLDKAADLASDQPCASFKTVRGRIIQSSP